MTHPGLDLKVAFRRARRGPAMSLLIVATLGVVLGANTLTFSFVNEIILNPLPAITDRAGLVNVHRWQNDKDGVQGFSYPAYHALAQADVFPSGLVAFNGRGLALERNGTPELTFGMLVSENYFDVLGVRPAIGRGLSAADNRRGSAGVVVLSDAIWRTRFGSDPKILGAPVRLNGHSFTVIGIGPERFNGHFVGFAADLWIPLSWGPAVSGQRDLLENPATEWLEAFGRLKPGTSAIAAAALTRINRSLPRVEVAGPTPERILVEPLTGIDRDLRGPVAAFLALLQAATILVTLIALVNVSSLLLARGLERGQETAVRLALGASPSSLLAPFAMEAVMFCGAGAALGLGLAVAGARIAPGWLPLFAIPIRFGLALDGRTFAFSVIVALLGTLTAALGPGLAAVRVPSSGLRERDPLGTRRSRWASALVVLQVAFATAVLASGSVFARFLADSANASPGYDIDRVQITRLDTAVLGLDADSGRALQRQAIDAVRRLPGVDRVSYARVSPYSIATLSLEARNAAKGAGAPWFKADWNAVSAGFFETLGVRPALGRTFSEFDTRDAPRVVVINESLAGRLFPNEAAVGRTIVTGPKDDVATVVGVVKDLSLRRLGEAPRPQLYRPFDQAPSPRISVLTRSANPKALASVIRPALAQAARDLPLLESLPLRDFASFSQSGARLGSRAGLALGGLGLALAAVGLFGLVAQTVASRVREIAIRMAVGATSRQILAQVLREAGGLSLAGLGIGLLGAGAATPLVQQLIPEMAAVDPRAFLLAALAAGAVTAGAAFGPAWRASRISPAEALRAN